MVLLKKRIPLQRPLWNECGPHSRQTKYMRLRVMKECVSITSTDIPEPFVLKHVLL